MDDFRHSDSVIVARSPEDLYDMVSDVTRMGEWSPVTKSGRWHDGDGPRVGAWFSGYNETPDKKWEGPCEVVVADRGREFTFLLTGQMVWWSYTFTPVAGGTRVTESWEFLPNGIAWVRKNCPDDAQAQIDRRVTNAHTGIAATLAAIKRVAESELGITVAP
jgi:Polyketide cyclase / dehydrase and lipid transport